MHPIKPELNGQSLASNQDPTGKYLFREFVDTVKASGAGYVWYLWPKPGSDKPVQKVSYVQGFAPWGWVVGSGVYVDNVDSAIVQRLGRAGAGAALLMVAVVAIGVWITRSVLRDLGGEPSVAVALTRRMAQGDLSMDIQLEPHDTTSLLHAMREMQHSLLMIVERVREGAVSVSRASADIESGDQNLSARTEQQASAIEQTSASMEQLGSMVRQNADSAQSANQLALNASQVATRTGDVVGQVVDTMKGINTSSKRIFDIISVIDGIAFQTNILALNAAVEAARAGEQGRGFAVVASEVRSLAGRSAEAAKEIKTLIGASVDRVERGTELVDRAGATMAELVASIEQLTTLMASISSASQEQSLGVSQVGEAVALMDQATQKNAAMVQDVAASAAHLKAQAQVLVDAVAVFRLEKQDNRLG
jgi:methyl-accepting chemotaxis protein